MKFWVIHPPAFCNPNQAPSSAASDSRWPHLFLKQRRHPFQKHHPKRCWIPSTGHRDKGKTIPEANVKQALQIKNLWNACVRYVWGWTRSYKKWNRAPRIFELTMTTSILAPPNPQQAQCQEVRKQSLQSFSSLQYLRLFVPICQRILSVPVEQPFELLALKSDCKARGRGRFKGHAGETTVHVEQRHVTWKHCCRAFVAMNGIQ